MKVKYSRDVNIPLVSLSDEPVDYAEETDGAIAHLSTIGKPVHLEFQGAREFLLSSQTGLLKDEEVSLP